MNRRPDLTPEAAVAAASSRTKIATYPTYAQAQRAVDFLSDRKFPVEHLSIVGNNLRTIETITGRLTWGRVAGMGATAGAWFGLLIGLFLAAFADHSVPLLGLLLWGLVWGAIAGLIFALISYAFTGGRRDFTGQSQIVADSYELLADPVQAAAATEVLSNLPAR